MGSGHADPLINHHANRSIHFNGETPHNDIFSISGFDRETRTRESYYNRSYATKLTQEHDYFLIPTKLHDIIDYKTPYMITLTLILPFNTIS